MLNFFTDSEGNLHFIVVLAIKLNYKMWPFYLQRKSWLKLWNFWCLQEPCIFSVTSGLGWNHSLYFYFPGSVLCWGCCCCLNLLAPQQPQKLNMPCMLPSYNKSHGSSVLLEEMGFRGGENLPKELFDLLTVSVIHSWFLRDRWAVELVVARCHG